MSASGYDRYLVEMEQEIFSGLPNDGDIKRNAIGVYLLIKGHPILIDLEDYERVSVKAWSITQGQAPQVQGRIVVDQRELRINLSRFILGVLDDRIVSRRGGYGRFDFRKEALYICDGMRTRQCLLAKRKAKSTSKYKGVSLVKKNGLWRASIRPDGASLGLGEYATEEEAARAYNRAALKYFGPETYLNPVDDESESKSVQPSDSK